MKNLEMDVCASNIIHPEAVNKAKRVYQVMILYLI